MRLFWILAALVLTACDNPRLGVGATFSGNGMSASPVVSGDVGGATVSVSG